MMVLKYFNRYITLIIYDNFQSSEIWSTIYGVFISLCQSSYYLNFYDFQTYKLIYFIDIIIARVSFKYHDHILQSVKYFLKKEILKVIILLITYNYL